MAKYSYEFKKKIVVNGKIKYTKNGHEKYTRIRHQKGATFATKYTT